MARRAVTIELSAKVRRQLELWVVRSRPALARRARVVLLAASGAENRTIAAQLGLSENAVSGWRRRFREEGLDGLRDRGGRGRKRRYGAEERLAAVLCGRSGDPASPSTVRQISAVAPVKGMSKSTVARLRRVVDLRQPGLDAWLAQQRPELEPATVALRGLYVKSSACAFVLELDEASRAGVVARGRRFSARASFTVEPYRSASLLAPLLAHGPGGGRGEGSEGAAVMSLAEFLSEWEGAPRSRRMLVVAQLEPDQIEVLDGWVGDRPGFELLVLPSRDLWRLHLQLWASLLGSGRARSALFEGRAELAAGLRRLVLERESETRPFVWIFESQNSLMNLNSGTRAVAVGERRRRGRRSMPWGTVGLD